MGLQSSGCLQLNQDFQGNLSLSPSPTQDTELKTLGDTSPSTEEMTTQLTSSHSFRDEPDPASQESIVVSDQAGSSASSNQSSVASTSTSALGSSASNSSTSSTSTVTLNQAIWIPITVANPSATQPLLQGTSVRLSFDHAALVTRGAALDGSNLLVMVTRNGVSTQLHRVLDPQSRWNDAATQVWFSLNQDVPVSASEQNIYHLVVHPSTSVLADPALVFLLYDTFDGPTLDNSKWDTGERGNGAGSSRSGLSSGELQLRATSAGVQRRARWVRSIGSWRLEAIAVDSSVRARHHTDTQNCTEEYISSLWSIHSPPWLNASLVQKEQALQFANEKDFGGMHFQSLSNNLQAHTQHRYSTRWIGRDFQIWRDEVLVDTKQTLNSSSSTPNSEPIKAGFEAVGVGGACNNVESQIDVDWVMVRKLSLAEPQLTLMTADETLRAP